MNKDCSHPHFVGGCWTSSRMRVEEVKGFLQHLEDAHEDPMEPARLVTCADTAKVLPLQDNWVEVVFKPEV